MATGEDHVAPSLPMLHLRIPCEDEREFHARLAGRFAARGLRVPTDAPRPVGTSVRVALELKNGATVVGEGVVDALVRLENGQGVNVGELRFGKDEGGRESRRASEEKAPRKARPARRVAPGGLPVDDEPLVGPGPGEGTSAPAAQRTSLPHEPRGAYVLVEEDERLGAPDEEVLDGVDVDVDVHANARGELLAVEDELLVPEDVDAASGVGERVALPYSGATSTEVVASVRRSGSRARRGALVTGLAALAVAAGASVGLRHLGAVGPEATVAAHVTASDRLLAQGRLTGKGGALEHLLAARRLRPDDAAARSRLSRAADLLEALAARALERGDLSVADIHLTSAEQADPGRPSLREKRKALARASAKGSAARRR